MKNFTTIDEMELLGIDGGDSCNKVDELLSIAGKISEWIKRLFD